MLGNWGVGRLKRLRDSRLPWVTLASLSVAPCFAEAVRLRVVPWWLAGGGQLEQGSRAPACRP